MLTLPALVLGLVVAGGVTTATAAATWLPITDVSAGGQEARDPQVDVSADGRRVMAVWYRLDAGSGRYLIQVGRSMDGGATWLAPQDLSAATQDWRWPRVAASDDGMRAVVVWQGWDGDVWSRSTQDGGATWTAAQHLSNGPSPTNPHVVMSYDGLRVTVAWDDVVPDPGLWYAAVMARSSTDGGATWSGPGRVSPVQDPCDGVDLVATPDGMRVTAAWRAVGHTAVGVGVSSDGGSNWNVSTVTTAPTAVWDLDLASSVDGIDVAVVWGFQPVFARVSHDSGTTWAPVVTLDGRGYWPQVTMSGDGQRLTALWYSTDTEYHMWTVTRSSTDRGAIWSAPQHLSANLDPSPSADNRPLLAGAGERVTAFWSRGNTSDSYDTLQTAETADGGATWSSALDLSMTDRPARVAAAATSADGSAVTAVWEEWDSTQTTTTRIRTRSKAAPPAIVSVTPPTGPTTGGTSVGILGSGFGGATSVTFGSVPATSFTVWSPTHITATSPPGSPGTVGVTVTTAAGSASLPGAFAYVAPPPTDVTPPVTRMVNPTTPVAWSTTIRMTFSGRDVGGAVSSYQVQRAVKAPGGALGGYVNYGGPRTTASVTMTGAKPGYGYCFRVRGTDTAGNTSGWSGAACQTMPGDDRALAGRGWSRVSSRTAYLRTLTVSRTKGATLVLPKSRGSYLTLVVNKAPGGGTLGVYVKGKRVATVPTTARRAALKALVTVRVRTAGVPVVLRLDAPGTRGVAIDGIAQLP